MGKIKVDISGINTSSLIALKHDEMINLFKLYKNGDNKAKNSLIEGNLKLVLSILKKYQNRCDNMDDLFQTGVIGLIKSVENFDLNFGVKFSTYAVLMIEGEIKRYIRDNNSIRISRSIKELSYAIINYREKYLSDNMKYPSNDDICNFFNINEYELNMILSSLSDVISIFDPVYSDSGDTIYLLDQLEDISSLNMNELLELKDSLLKLKDRERKIIEERYFMGYSQSEIANNLHISQAQVSRIENNAIKSIKKLLL